MIRLCVVSDSILFREGLVRILESHPGLRVIACAPTVQKLTSELAGPAPDVVLLDITTPDSLRAIHAIVNALPGTKVVVLGVPENEANIIACAEAGAAGYVCREATVEELNQALEQANSGELRCSGRIAAALFRRIQRLAGDRLMQHNISLTHRECEIMQLVDKGLTNKEIASYLTIEVATVKNHVHNILEKLGVHTRGEAAAILRRHHSSSFNILQP